MFQFHKVRLKVERRCNKYVVVKFQFHKVRLKVKPDPTNPSDHIAFQFHKVRLKG